MGAQFANVGTDKAIDLTDIKVTGYEGTSEGVVQIQTLDYLGRGEKTYFFYDVPDDELFGWYYDDEPVEKGTVTLKLGDGMWLKAPDTNHGIQTAGQVETDDYAVTLRAGRMMVVNSTPVAADLTKIDVAGYTGVSEGTVQVQTLDYLGRGEKTYFFYDVPEDELFGWYYDDEPVEEGAMMIQPGEGLWTKAPSADYSVTMPGVSIN